MLAGAAGGLATAWTGVGAVVGGAAVVHGADGFAAGLRQAWTGQETKTFTEQGISKGLQAAGVSEKKANLAAAYADGGISIALTGGAGAVRNIPVIAKTANVGKGIIHHIASNKHLSRYTPQFEAIATKYNLKLNQSWNKVVISDAYHYSPHPKQYHEFVLDGMRAADVGAAGNQAKFLQLFDQYVKQPLLQNQNMLNKTGW